MFSRKLDAHSATAPLLILSDCQAVTSIAGAFAVDGWLTQLHDRAKAGLLSNWMIIQRCWDATPLHLSFGQLEKVLQPTARYHTMSAQQTGQLQVKFHRLTWQEVQALTGDGAPVSTHSGIVEMLAETLSIHCNARLSGTVELAVCKRVPPF